MAKHYICDASIGWVTQRARSLYPKLEFTDLQWRNRVTRERAAQGVATLGLPHSYTIMESLVVLNGHRNITISLSNELNAVSS